MPLMIQISRNIAPKIKKMNFQSSKKKRLIQSLRKLSLLLVTTKQRLKSKKLYQKKQLWQVQPEDPPDCKRVKRKQVKRRKKKLKNSRVKRVKKRRQLKKMKNRKQN